MSARSTAAQLPGLACLQAYGSVRTHMPNGGSHAKQHNRARRELKRLRTILGRVVRDIRRKIEGNPALTDVFRRPLWLAERVATQTRRDPLPKVYSLHAPEVECIGKGKAAKPYEFGCKVTVATTNARSPGGQFVVHIDAPHGNPYDGHTLKAAIEPVIGHMKNDGLARPQFPQGQGRRPHQRHPVRRRTQLPPPAQVDEASFVPDPGNHADNQPRASGHGRPGVIAANGFFTDDDIPPYCLHQCHRHNSGTPAWTFPWRRDKTALVAHPSSEKTFADPHRPANAHTIQIRRFRAGKWSAESRSQSGGP